MREEFVVLVNVTFNGNNFDAHGGTFGGYPTEEHIDNIVSRFEKMKDFTVWYAKVEKRYKRV